LQTRTGDANKDGNNIRLNASKYGMYLTIVDERNNRQTLKLNQE
jgi:hypothetical protein